MLLNSDSFKTWLAFDSGRLDNLNKEKKYLKYDLASFRGV